ncbi:MAG: hypothetical protein MJ097_05225 [Dorea sp.]|nr:hypothetical protein [Dorea sp.]
MSKTFRKIPFSNVHYQETYDGTHMVLNGLMDIDDFKEKMQYRDMMFQQYDRIIKEGRPVNTFGADYYLLKGFVTEDMYWDFDVILKDFLEHCSDKLEKFDKMVWFHNDDIWRATPRKLLVTRVMNLIYNGSRAGDEYCIALMKQLYMTYHKKEYKILKRFKRISSEEIVSFHEEDDCSVEQQTIYGRILGMCRLLGIGLDDHSVIMYKLLEQDCKRELEEEDLPKFNFEELSDELMSESMDQIEQWLEENGNPRKMIRKLKHTFKVQEYVTKCLHFHGYPEYYVEDSLENYMGIKLQMARALGMLKLTYPGEEWTWEEVQNYTIIYTLVASLTDVSEQMQEDIGLLLKAEDQYRRSEEEKPFFRPEKIKLSQPSNKANVVPTRSVTAVPTHVKTKGLTEEDYLKEIEELRQKLNAKERALNNIKDLYHTEKQNSSQYRALLAKYESEHEELISLREYAFHSTEEQEEIGTEALDDMKAVVAQKKIMLVGGHTNWLNKLKIEFPDWIYIPAEISTVCDGKMLENLDKLYFFTDHLSHGTYGKYVTMAREKKIPFGYISNINLEMIVRQVWEDVT